MYRTKLNYGYYHVLLILNYIENSLSNNESTQHYHYYFFAKKYFSLKSYLAYLKTEKNKPSSIWLELTQKHHSNHPKVL